MILSHEDIAYLEVDLKGTDMRSMTRGAELYKRINLESGRSILVHVFCSDTVCDEEQYGEVE